MRRVAPLLLVLAAGTAAAEPPAAVPPALSQPAALTPRALGAATLAVARAGARLVAVGERGTVLLSDDQGLHWRQAAVPVQTALTAVRFANARVGLALGHMGVILRTADGGEHWTKQLDGVQAAAQVLEAADRSGDATAVQRAQRLVAEGPDKPFLDVEFVTPDKAIAVGAYNLAFASEDGGRRWTPIGTRLPNPRGLHLYGVRALGDALLIAGEQGLLLRSLDGGASFSPIASPYNGSFFGLLAAHSGTVLAYGLRGNAWRSADRGASWEKVDTGTAVAFSAATELPGGALALLSQGGEVLVSRDDGRSFVRRPQRDNVPATGLAAADGGPLVLASLRGMRRQDGL